MNRTIFTGIAVLAMSVLPCTSALAQGSTAEQDRPAQADMNGDGRADSLSLQQVSQNTLLLRVGLTEEFVDAKIGGDARDQPLVPVDVNGDGFDEVMVPVSVGANTITYEVWQYSADQGLNPVRTADGKPWQLFQGGGIAAVSTQGCSPANAERRLDNVGASLGTDNTYTGGRTTYSVRNGVATVVNQIQIEGAQREDPRLQADPATCAPLA